MRDLHITSCMAPNADFVCADLAGYIGEQLQLPTACICDIPWQERERLFDAADIQVCWICGLPYVWKADLGQPPLELLVAPVMQGARYQNRPIYFSDVIVLRTSRFHTFADLRGATWAYNEPGSHSGYNVVRYHLATLGETAGFFGRVIESGAHQASLQLLLAGVIDATAIDSTVLETELQHHPEIATYIRVIATLGPSPIPPWVVLRSVPEEVRTALRTVLLQMHIEPRGHALLATARIARFEQVDDRAYDAIRRMTRQAANVTL
ncbi:MAG TPA: PhnD/SsuA/transferrin family substrate-binding protein [Roseiflexaceae bacterium]